MGIVSASSSFVWKDYGVYPKPNKFKGRRKIGIVSLKISNIICIISNIICIIVGLILEALITTAADSILIFLFFSEKIWLEISCESSA